MVQEGIIRFDDEGHLWRVSELYNGPGAKGGVLMRRACEPRLAEKKVRGDYVVFCFGTHKKTYQAMINRLSYIVAHNGEINDALPVDHIDFDRRNNRPSNLQQVTVMENNHRSIAAGRWSPRSRHLLLTDDQVRDIRRRSSEPDARLAKEYGCSRPLVNHIQHYRAYAWVKE